MSETPSVEDAVRRIAARCDGAVTDDGVGFNGHDTHFGRRLAALPDDAWTAAMRYEAWKMLRTYKGQLATCGVDYDEIPAPDPVIGDGRNDARMVYRRHHPAEEVSRTVRLRGDRYVFVLGRPQAEGLYEALRGIPGAKWVPAGAPTPLSHPRSGSMVVNRCAAAAELADKWLFEADDDATTLALLADIALGPEPDPINVTLAADGSHIVVTFPYDAMVVATVRGVPGAKWNREQQHWTVPLSSVEQVLEAAEALHFSVDPAVEELVARRRADAEAAAAASRALEADLHIDGLARELRPFQRAGVAYMLTKRRSILGDEMGLGKTAQAIAAAAAADQWPVLVVCPSSLKLAWEAEIKAWLPERTVSVVFGTKPAAIPAADFCVVSYHLLSSRKDDLLAFGPRALILDEAHSIKSAKAAWTKAAHVLAKSVQKVDGPIWALSGTPVLNRPADLIEPLKALNLLDEFGGWKHFVRRYCAGYIAPARGRMPSHWEIGGASHKDELHAKLRETCFIRRTKKDVMPDLPPVQVCEVPIETTKAGMAAYVKAERDVVEFLVQKAMEEGESGWEARMRAQAAEHLVKINTLRQLAAQAKLPAVIEWVKDWHESGGGKLVIFAWHKEIQEALAKELGAVTIFGGQDPKEVEQNKRRFQTDETVRTIVCSIAAAKEGHTLTAASDVVFVEEAWTPAAIAQATARCYGRLNDAHGVNAYHLIAKGTIDEAMVGLVASKAAVVDAVVDGVDTGAKGRGSALGGVLIRLIKQGMSQRSESTAA